MTIIQIIVLSLIQGLTEFLPVSSSAHLILGGKVFGWPDQGLVFDVATHLGTLLAVLVYFRKDICVLARPWFGAGGGDEKNRKLGQILLVASVPAILFGGVFHSWVESALRDMRVIAFSTTGFGLLLWWADKRCACDRQLQEMDIRSGILIGLAQVLSLVPGTSRSGITITMGRFLGFDAESAARFSFLLSIPVILAAGSFGIYRVMSHGAAIAWLQFSMAVVISALAGWLCIAVFLALLQRVGLLPFVIYRLLLGIVLLWISF